MQAEDTPAPPHRTTPFQDFTGSPQAMTGTQQSLPLTAGGLWGQCAGMCQYPTRLKIERVTTLADCNFFISGAHVTAVS